MGELVLRADQDGIAVLTLNRPQALNALSPATFIELRAHLEQISGATDRIGCVVLSGAGRSFSAGNDLKAIQAGERAPTPHFQAETLELIESLAQPVIAAVRGHCYTGALELALACDLLVCSETAQLADTHGRWAMTPTWGMSQRLPRRIGLVRARELMFTGRVLSGADAVAWGMANRCVPDAELESAALELARAIVANSWHTVFADKKLLRQSQEATLSAGLAWEREHSPGRGPDLEARLAAFGKKS